MRKGPQESAKKFSIGFNKRGNDGNIWTIIKNKNGVKRWQKSNKNNKTIKNKTTNKKRNKKNKKNKTTKNKSSKSFTYLIFNNGGRPFKVVIKGNNINIYHNNKNNKLIKSYKNTQKIFIPKGIDDEGNSWSGGKGNTILCHISGKRYVFIGPWIYEFEIKNDTILEYHSQVGNSGVPYPLAIGENNVYFLISTGAEGYVSKEYFEGFPKKYNWATDGYSRLWGQSHFTHLIKKAKKIPKIKVIVKKTYLFNY